MVIAEYRFQVQLNWDRAKHYFVFNATVLALAIGLLKLEGPPRLDTLVGVLFLLPFLTSISGIQAIRRGHQYYQNVRAKKSLVEQALGIEKFAIDSTPGMRQAPPKTRIRRLAKFCSSITGQLMLLLGAMSAGSILSLSHAFSAAPKDTAQSAGNGPPSLGAALTRPSDLAVPADLRPYDAQPEPLPQFGPPAPSPNR